MKILVDTVVWIHHFRMGEAILTDWLDKQAILMHPFVVGELACGNMKNRAETLTSLIELPHAEVASNEEVIQLIQDRKLWARGFGLVDAHLLASAILSDCRLWTTDTALLSAATELNVNLRLH